MIKTIPKIIIINKLLLMRKQRSNVCIIVIVKKISGYMVLIIYQLDISNALTHGITIWTLVTWDATHMTGAMYIQANAVIL